MAWMKVDGHAQAQFSQNCRCWKAPLEIIWSKNMLRAGSMNRMPRAMLAGFWISPRMETPTTKSNLFQWFLFVCFCFRFFFFFPPLPQSTLVFPTQPLPKVNWLLSLLAYVLFTPEFYQELLVLPCRATATFAWLLRMDCSWAWRR